MGLIRLIRFLIRTYFQIVTFLTVKTVILFFGIPAYVISFTLAYMIARSAHFERIIRHRQYEAATAASAAAAKNAPPPPYDKVVGNGGHANGNGREPNGNANRHGYTPENGPAGNGAAAEINHPISHCHHCCPLCPPPAPALAPAPPPPPPPPRYVPVPAPLPTPPPIGSHYYADWPPSPPPTPGPTPPESSGKYKLSLARRARLRAELAERRSQGRQPPILVYNDLKGGGGVVPMLLLHDPDRQ